MTSPPDPRDPRDHRDPKDKVCLGVIAGVHGVQGAVRIKSYTAEPGDITAYGPLSDEAASRELSLTVTGTSRGQLIARIAGIEDRDAAEALKGLRLYVARARLPEPGAEEFYHADLVGLVAEGGDGKRLGVIAAVHDFGAGDLLEVKLDAGGAVMVPFNAETAPEVDIAGGRIVIEPPPGLIGEDGGEDSRDPGGEDGGSE